MDSRIREALDAKAFDTIIRCRPARVIMYDDVLALLTAEPETCEDAHEWDALTKEEMWNEIQGIRRLVDSDGTKSICSDIEDYASQVADKRAEELRVQLTRANATLEEVAAQRNRAMEQVETLRDYLVRITNKKLTLMHDQDGKEVLACWPKDNPVTIAHEALAATEPNPSTKETKDD